MAASDHLGPQWYHGTNAELGSGDMLEPGRAPANSPRSQGHVYFTGGPGAASSWGQNVYEVRPTGKYARDPYGEVPGESGDHRSKKPVQVVRKLATDEYE